MPRGRSGRRWTPRGRGNWFDRNVKYLFLGLAAVAVFSLSTVALNSTRTPEASAYTPRGLALEPYEAAVEERPTLAIIGDSYTACSPMGGCGDTNYTNALSRELGWRVVSQSVGGTGYVNDRGGKTNFAERVNAVIAEQPDIVMIEGGRNDAFDLGVLPTAVTDTISRLQAGLPEAEIVVVGPITTGEIVEETHLRARDIITAAAETADVDLLIDPIAEEWFTGEGAMYVGPDGVHPTNEGHEFMARTLSDRLSVLALD